jgi:hypothetical protein
MHQDHELDPSSTIAVALSLALLTSCGGSGGASGSGGAGGNGRDGGACAALLNDGPTVREVRVAQQPPTPTGGSIVSGRYALTSLAIYTGPGGAAGPSSITYQVAFAFNMMSQTAGTVDAVEIRNGVPGNSICGSFTTMDTKYTIDSRRFGPLPGNYSANATEVQLQSFSVTDGTTSVSVLTKR